MNRIAPIAICLVLGGSACGPRGLPCIDGHDSDTSARRYLQVSSAFETVCAINQDNKVICWGKKLAGTPPPVARKVSVGYRYACAIDLGDALHCWGTDSGYGELMGSREGVRDVLAGPGITYLIVGTSLATSYRPEHPQDRYELPRDAAFRSLCSSGGIGCALDRNNFTYTWGANHVLPYTFTELPFDKVALYGYGAALCGIVHQEGDLVCRGDRGASDETSYPFGKDRRWRDVDAIGYTICAIDEDGLIHCDGPGDPAGLGDPPISITRPPPGAGYVQVSVGHYQACALHEDGHIDCWGENDYGQLDVPPP